MKELKTELVRRFYKFERNPKSDPNTNYKKGDIVKVVRNNERFYVTIYTVLDKDQYVTKVNSDLVNKQPFKSGDLILLNRANFFEKYN